MIRFSLNKKIVEFVNNGCKVYTGTFKSTNVIDWIKTHDYITICSFKIVDGETIEDYQAKLGAISDVAKNYLWFALYTKTKGITYLNPQIEVVGIETKDGLIAEYRVTNYNAIGGVSIYRHCDTLIEKAASTIKKALESKKSKKTVCLLNREDLKEVLAIPNLGECKEVLGFIQNELKQYVKGCGMVLNIHGALELTLY